MSISLDMQSGEMTPLDTVTQTTMPLLKTSADAFDRDDAATAAPGVTSPKNPEKPSVADAEPAVPALHWEKFTVSSGDSLSSLFKDAGFSSKLMLSVIHGDGKASELGKLYAGETIAFATNPEGELESVTLTRNELNSLSVKRTESGFSGEIVNRKPEIEEAFASGDVDGSLYKTARNAGLDDRLTMKMVGILGWRIDFDHDIRRGDHFGVLYERRFMNGKELQKGHILAATFINRGEKVTALRYENKNGKSSYYTPDGSSIRKAFAREPVQARISSSFDLHRYHPVLGITRPHEGTDFAARYGSTIKATGDGRIRSSGWKGGYGRAVVIEHGDNISTLYAHMSRFRKGLGRGDKVKQGEVIGYVGNSGLVTGTHLHYEYRANGSPRNSQTVKLPDASPIPDSEMADFKASTQPVLAALKSKQQDHRLALNNESN